MKWLVVPLEAFSPRGVKGRKTVNPRTGRQIASGVTDEDLPWAVREFLAAFPRPFIALDESSKIKTNAPMDEKKKSTRTRIVKLLNKRGERCIMTGTLKSKSPVNVYDQFDFLRSGYFPESMWEFAERYCVMETIFAGGERRRVLMSEKSWRETRERFKRAYARGLNMGGTASAEDVLRLSKDSVFREKAVSAANAEHIVRNQKYSPFVNQAELLRRIKPAALIVRRKDVFDISHEKFVMNPILRPVELADQGKKIIKRLVDVGFTDHYTLGRAPALELFHRIQDVCNGFEPIEEPLPDGADRPERVITHRPLGSNPKLDALMELLDEIGEDSQAAVWCSRKLLIRACAERFEKEGVSFVRYDGDIDDAGREEAQKRFAGDNARIFLANPASAAYGLNCLAKCSYAVFICVDDSVERYHQATLRLLRGELQAPKFSYHIYARGTMEERQLERLRAGRELLTDSNARSLFDVA
jgi:hypothetical protein